MCLSLCSQCDKTFSHNNNLKTHLITHTGDNSYQWMYCNKAITVNNSLIKRMCIHIEEKPYQCSQCNKAFSVKKYNNILEDTLAVLI